MRDPDRWSKMYLWKAKRSVTLFANGSFLEYFVKIKTFESETKIWLSKMSGESHRSRLKGTGGGLKSELGIAPMKGGKEAGIWWMLANSVSSPWENIFQYLQVCFPENQTWKQRLAIKAVSEASFTTCWRGRPRYIINEEACKPCGPSDFFPDRQKSQLLTPCV